LTVLPRIAAAVSRPSRIQRFISPVAAMAPATKRSESPGRNGVTTKPVSLKMMAKRIA
jgi:hypothetical protein